MIGRRWRGSGSRRGEEGGGRSYGSVVERRVGVREGYGLRWQNDKFPSLNTCHIKVPYN